MKLCPKCHQESLDGANFCANCGATLESKKQEVVVIITQPSSMPSKKLSRKAKYHQGIHDSSISSSQNSLDLKEDQREGIEKIEEKVSKVKSESTQTKSKDESSINIQNISLEKESLSSEKENKDPNKKEEDNPKDQDKKEESILAKKHLSFFKKDKSKEEDDDEDEEEEEENEEESQKWMVAAISFLGFLVIFLSGLLIYQGMVPQDGETKETGEALALQEQSKSDFEITEIKEENSQTSSSEKAQTKTLANQYTEEGKRRPVRAYERGASEEESEESSEEKETSQNTNQNQNKEDKDSNSSGTSTSNYQTNFVMNVRTGPSIDEDQINQIEAGQIIKIEKTQKNSDGAIWGKIAGSENWICISDSDTQYLTKITSQSESSPIAKVNIDDLIEQAGSVWNLFEDAMLIGDSRVYGFMSYGFIPASQVKAAGGYTINNIPEFLSAVAAMQPEVIYLSFGINDMGLNIGQEEGVDGYKVVYTRQIEALLENVPNATIVVNSVIDATPAAVARSPRWDKVADFNRQIKEMCQEHDWIYVDNDPLAQNGNAPIYNADGVHLVSTFYEPWAKNMLQARYSEI